MYSVWCEFKVSKVSKPYLDRLGATSWSSLTTMPLTSSQRDGSMPYSSSGMMRQLLVLYWPFFYMRSICSLTPVDRWDNVDNVALSHIKIFCWSQVWPQVNFARCMFFLRFFGNSVKRLAEMASYLQFSQSPMKAKLNWATLCNFLGLMTWLWASSIWNTCSLSGGWPSKRRYSTVPTW